MTNQPDLQHDLNILDKIEEDPETTQASLASQLGVAVGTINWHLKRLIDKGYVKVRRAQRRKLKYLITPEGISHRARLTLDYINTSFHLFRLVRERMIAALHELHPSGVKTIRLTGDGDVAEVCRLTCIEQGFTVLGDEDPDPDAPTAHFRIVDLRIIRVSPEEQPDNWPDDAGGL
ncbi:MAG: winged helix-turn-helix transcriptional regulator [Anaerolineaceae bacterium]